MRLYATNNSLLHTHLKLSLRQFPLVLLTIYINIVRNIQTQNIISPRLSSLALLRDALTSFGVPHFVTCLLEPAAQEVLEGRQKPTPTAEKTFVSGKQAATLIGEVIEYKMNLTLGLASIFPQQNILILHISPACLVFSDQIPVGFSGNSTSIIDWRKAIMGNMTKKAKRNTRTRANL